MDFDKVKDDVLRSDLADKLEELHCRVEKIKDAVKELERWVVLEIL
ncbi:MAG: hypothetical protein IJ520_02710 [Synergistaceae bacterium]|nr:hypothetical protein [Synergistaceae bacterium]